MEAVDEVDCSGMVDYWWSGWVPLAIDDLRDHIAAEMLWQPCWPVMQYCQEAVCCGLKQIQAREQYLSPNLVLKWIDKSDFWMRNNFELKFNLEG